MLPRERFLAKGAKVANAILVGEGVAAALALLFLIHRYGWSVQENLAGSGRVLMYYAVPTVLAGLFFVSLRLQAGYKIALTILSLSLIVSIYGVELGLNVADSMHFGAKKFFLPIDSSSSDEVKQKAREFAKQFGIDYDTRNRLEFITDLRRRGTQAVLTMAPDWLFTSDSNGGLKSAISIGGVEVHPLGGIANKLTVLCNETGSWVTFQSDEHGFNNPKGLWQSRRLDIAAVGDSYTQGECVSADKNFVDLIRERYSATLNLGMRGSGPLLELATIREFLPTFKPKIVLWFYYEGNDLTNLQVEQKSNLLKRYLTDGFNQGLRERQGEIDQTLTDYVDRLEAREGAGRVSRGKTISAAALMRGMKLSALRQRLGLVYRAAPNVSYFREILLQAKTTVSAWGGELYFIYLPSWWSYARSPYPTEVAIPSETDIKERPRVLSVVKELGIPLIDLYPVIGAQRDPLALFPFKRWGHYNEEGNRLVAEKVLRVLKRRVPSLSVSGSTTYSVEQLARRNDESPRAN